MKKKSVHNFKVFIDCGAPSLYNKLSRNEQSSSNARGTMGTKMSERKFDDYSYVESPYYEEYRQNYIDFMLKHKNEVDVYSNLDVINNPRLTYENQKIIEAAGLSPIPVWHLSTNKDDLKYLQMYLKEYDYIAIGGLVPNPTTVLIPMLDALFKEQLVDEKGFPKAKYHGFACTSLPLMKRYPWYSVDSATCRKLANFGSIVVPIYNNYENPIKTFQVSSRPKILKDEGEGFFSGDEAPTGDWLSGMSKQTRKAFDLRLEKFDMTIQQLGDSIIHRVVWNYLMFSEVIQITVPNWPWSLNTRMVKGRSEEYMTFYFAGILSKSEEETFWKGIAVDHVDKLKGTLRSFFYEKNAEYVLSLKGK